MEKIKHNYGGMAEERDRPVYHGKDSKKTHFYEKAGLIIGGTILTALTTFGIPDFDTPKQNAKQQDSVTDTQKSAIPKGILDLLKTSEADAQEQINVCIEEFTEGNHYDRSDVRGLGKSISDRLIQDLNKKGINIGYCSPYNSKIITMYGHCELVLGTGGTENYHISIGYKENGNPIEGGVEGNFDTYFYNDRMNQIANMVIEQIVSAENQIAAKK